MNKIINTKPSKLCVIQSLKGKTTVYTFQHTFKRYNWHVQSNYISKSLQKSCINYPILLCFLLKNKY